MKAMAKREMGLVISREQYHLTSKALILKTLGKKMKIRKTSRGWGRIPSCRKLYTIHPCLVYLYNTVFGVD